MMNKQWLIRVTLPLITSLAVLGMVTLSSASDALQEAPDRVMIESSIEAVRAQKQQKISGAKQKNPGSAKLGRFIRTIVARHGDRTASKQTSLDSTPFVHVKDGTSVQVYVSIAEAGEMSLNILEQQGLAIELVNTKLKKVQGWIDVASIAALSTDTNVLHISTPVYARVRTGMANTQGDAILRADTLRQLGLTGKGVKVGVISDGANNWQQAHATGDLPDNVTTYGTCIPRIANPSECRSEWTCNEGTAMAEIIHDIAPDAELAVAAVKTSLEFIERINQLTNTFEADVIVDDLGFYGQPYFEDGELAQAVAAVPERVLYITSAGNSGKKHYEGDFIQMSGSAHHDFGAREGTSADDTIGFSISPYRGAYVMLQWNDAFDNPTSDYDLYIFNQAGLETSSVWHEPPAIEGVCVYNPSSSKAIRHASVDSFSGPGGRRLEMFFLGARAVEYPTIEGSIFGHSGVERVVTVGTINAEDAEAGSIAYYSSRGPARIDFPVVVNRTKPDLVAIDGVDVTGAGGFGSPFYGTSAAAPHVAGVAALLMSTNSLVKAPNVRKALVESARDLGDSGFDSTYGHGLIDAVAAEKALIKGSPIPALRMLLREIEDD